MWLVDVCNNLCIIWVMDLYLLTLRAYWLDCGILFKGHVFLSHGCSDSNMFIKLLEDVVAWSVAGERFGQDCAAVVLALYCACKDCPWMAVQTQHPKCKYCHPEELHTNPKILTTTPFRNSMPASV